MTLVLDAGAFIAVGRGDRDIAALVKRERLAERSPVSHGGIVAQVWRDGGQRRAAIARLLAGVDVHALDEQLGRRTGLLLGRAEQSDVIDAALVCLADDGDEILTADVDDLRPLAETAGVHVDLVPV